MDEKRRSRRSDVKNCENLSFAAKEAFKRLRTNLLLTFPDNDAFCPIIGVTSAQPAEGKSTVALNLAYSLAELEKNVLLLDSDMRRPSIHVKANIERTPGLADLLSTSNTIASSVHKYQSSTSATSFDILPGGEVPPNPSELLTSKRMETLLKTLKTAYDFIILDLPPIGAVIDAVSVSKKTDGMLVVMRENHCPIGILKDCVTQIQDAGVPILGFVVNGALEGAGKKYGYGYGYGYGKGYGSYYGSYYR